MVVITSSQFDYVPQKEEGSNINYNFEERRKIKNVKGLCYVDGTIGAFHNFKIMELLKLLILKSWQLLKLGKGYMGAYNTILYFHNRKK